MDEVTLSLSPEAIAYSWQQLLQRAGCAPLDVPLWYADPTRAPAGFGGVIVVPCTETDPGALLERPPGTLSALPLEQVFPPDVQPSFREPIPVLFWGTGCKEAGRPFAQLLSDSRLIFHADIIAATFFMLSRWEETVVPTRDEHGRFPATASVAYKQGFLDRPIIDEYALILREWLKVFLPGWQPKQHHFSVKLSHDVDHVKRFSTLSQAVRVLGSDLLKRRNPRRAWQTTTELAIQTFRPDQTADMQGLALLSELATQHHLDAAFYFMAAAPSPFDSGYDPASPTVRALIQHLRQQGFEIGFHPSYHTFDNLARLAREKAQLEAILGKALSGGRQHYLHFRVPDTWRHWEEVGLTYDSTLGYADHEGFRCGTCHPFAPFDIQQNRPLNLQEVPIIAMDRTLQRYRGFSPLQAAQRIVALACRCQQVEGMFTLLWHSSTIDSDNGPWTAAYRQIIAALAQMQTEGC